MDFLVKYKQLQHEIDSWKRTLVFLVEENLFLKKRLSEILKESFHNSTLEEAENFQNRLLKEDVLVSFLRNGLAELDQLLEKEMNTKKKMNNKLENRIRRIRESMKSADADFSKLRDDFNIKFSKHI